jgi:hypothetical protein
VIFEESMESDPESCLHVVDDANSRNNICGSVTMVDRLLRGKELSSFLADVQAASSSPLSYDLFGSSWLKKCRPSRTQEQRGPSYDPHDACLSIFASCFI